MFTGIIKSVSQIKKSETKDGLLVLTIAKPESWDLQPGDSIATNGVCLTVKKVDDKSYTTELMPETKNKTVFGKEVPEEVNLERSLKLSDRLDGHLVQGHVDAVGIVTKIDIDGSTKIFTISFPDEFSHLITPKGSITVDGVSLTVIDVNENKFTVSIIDYTLDHTNLKSKKEGEEVNLEFDIIAKYLYANR
ncbi:MAG: riboflavin synthase [Parcubacteria group bacterium]|nr:riboflavin synthase [Parcubacteria group bacterium]|tara:strand:+ start:3803 stop:4378 length:576 start_codon:yes stop_codon:yes gene_type:complete